MISAVEWKIAEAGGAVRRWMWRALLSIADQGLVSGANFLLVVLFARWLSPPDYGAVSVGLSVFLLAANFHHALLLEPMSVLGPRHFSDRLSRYFLAVMLAHLGAVAALAAALGCAALALGAPAPAVSSALVGLTLSTPLVLSFWLLRRICYVTGDPAAALRGGAAFLVCSALGAVLVSARGWTNAAALFVVTGAAALLACAALTPRLGRRTNGRGAPIRLLLGEVLRRHWHYGRWMVGVSLTHWVANSALPVLLCLSTGLTASAELRALENLVTPVLQATNALALLLLPWVSGQTHALGPAYLLRFRRHAALAAFALTAGYLGPVVLFRRPLIKLFYGPGAYGSLAGLVPVMAAATLVRGVTDLSLSTALKGAARPDAHLYATLASSAFVLTVGWWLVGRFGVAGAAFALLTGNLTQAAVLAGFYLQLTRSGSEVHGAAD